MLKLRINEIIYPSKKISYYVYVVHILLLINLPQKIQEAVLNVEITVTKQKQLDKWKVFSINYTYFAKMFKFSVIKLKLLRKSSDFWLLGLTNVTLMLRKFIISKLRILIQKLIVVKGSNCFVHGDKFLSIFQILIFLYYKPL